jgi:3-methyl-2-oxobutanoate hydroxymethyltransferase
MSDVEAKKVTVPALLAMKRRGEKIAMLSTYDYPMAKIAGRAGVDVILVGDTLGMVVLGYETTLPVTMDEMLCHVKAVARARPNSLVVADMPFMSFQVSREEAIHNAGRMIKEGGAEAVKIEGGRCIAETVRAMNTAKLPVMGHVGLTPQAVCKFGGYKVQGRSEHARAAILEDALALEEAGCFSVVLEGIPWKLAREITEKLTIPTIGIGAGPHCDGQVLVSHDLLGLFDEYVPKFVRKYADLRTVIGNAFGSYVKDIKAGSFPSLDESYDDAQDRKKD